jgi:hypothetical protein
MKPFEIIVHWLVAAIVAVSLLWVVVIQGNTITQQRKLIRDMEHNPNCMIP